MEEVQIGMECHSNHSSSKDYVHTKIYRWTYVSMFRNITAQHVSRVLAIIDIVSSSDKSL